ncbi:hypothetical protein LP420_41155 [Massilia sp. B-10]|nr:hypothetical protein LP420_41155 [Massilia sp. B-10]
MIATFTAQHALPAAGAIDLQAVPHCPDAAARRATTPMSRMAARTVSRRLPTGACRRHGNSMPSTPAPRPT